MSPVYSVHKPDPRRAPALPPRTTFRLWDAVFFLDQDTVSLRQADEVIFGHWDDFADQAFQVLHQMITQTERLMFPDDEYTDLARTLQAFPHRPSLPSVLGGNAYDEHEYAPEAMPHLDKTPVQKVWHVWATRVEEIYEYLAANMRRCGLPGGMGTTLAWRICPLLRRICRRPTV